MENNIKIKKSEYNKCYYLNNKDYWKEKKECDICHHFYRVSGKYRHFNSNKHKLALQQKQIEELIYFKNKMIQINNIIQN